MKSAPKKGSSSSIHCYCQKCSAEGFFQKLWEKGLAQYDDLEGIAWKWQSIDSCMIKAPTAQESAGAIWYGNQATASGFRQPAS